MNTLPWNLNLKDQAAAARLKERLQPKLDEIFDSLYTGLVKETEQQLKDAETLASEPRGWLNTKRIKGKFKKKDMGEWHVQKANQ